MIEHFEVSEEARVKNRYGNFVRFGSVWVFRMEDGVKIDALFKEGSEAGGLFLTDAEARRLADMLKRAARRPRTKRPKRAAPPEVWSEIDAAIRRDQAVVEKEFNEHQKEKP